MDGCFEDWVDDVVAAAEILQRETGVHDVGLLGLRFGCAIGVFSAARLARLSSMVLWDPPLEIGREFKGMTRRDVVRRAWGDAPEPEESAMMARPEEAGDGSRYEETVDLEGFSVGVGLLDELRRLRWEDAPSDLPHRMRVAIVPLGLQDRSSALAGRIGRRLADARIEVLSLREPCPRFWSRLGIVVAHELIESTVAWIRNDPAAEEQGSRP